ncbi:MAG TPA: hypothetical protein VHE35_04865 [Kofleriaceae bacterium]|nr:hypothetical protein [Kofleriaceae bacterium]
MTAPLNDDFRDIIACLRDAAADFIIVGAHAPDGVEPMPWEYRAVVRLRCLDGAIEERAELAAEMEEARAALAAGRPDRAAAVFERSGLGWLAGRLRG